MSQCIFAAVYINKLIKKPCLKTHKLPCDESMIKNLGIDWLNLKRMKFLRACLLWQDTFKGVVKMT